MQNFKNLDRSMDSNRNFIVVSIIVFTIILVGMLFCSCRNDDVRLYNIENYQYSEKIDSFIVNDKVYDVKTYSNAIAGTRHAYQFYAIAEKDGTIYKIPINFALYNEIENNDKICIKTYSDSKYYTIFVLNNN